MIIHRTKSTGFTIVEMMVVVAIIGILAGLSAFAFRGWQQGLAQREARSDLQSVALAMENAKNFNNAYPTDLPSNYSASDGLTVRYVGGNATNYCIEARSTRVTSVVFYVKSRSEAAQGTCDSAYALTTPAPVMSASTYDSITISWPAVSGASSYVVEYGTASPTTTAGCATSPCIINSLAASTQYKFTVTAKSAYSTKKSAVVSGSTTAAPLRCNSGDTKSGNTCTNTYNASYNPGTSGFYYCPNGGTLSGTSCTSSDSYPATYASGGLDYCNPPDTYYSPGVCQTPSGSLMSSESQGYYCPNGGTLSGTTCYRNNSYPASYNSGTAPSYYCPSGGTLSGTTCTRTYPAY